MHNCVFNFKIIRNFCVFAIVILRKMWYTITEVIKYAFKRLKKAI